MPSIKSTFDRILDALKEVLRNGDSVFDTKIKPGPVIKFSDLEIIALACTAEYLGYTSENHLFKELDKKEFPISRRQYNDRRKRLLHKIELIRQKIYFQIIPPKTDAFIVDSMPLKVCRIARMYRNKVGKDNTLGLFADTGRCAAQEEKYFGYKLHATCTLDGVLATVAFTPASVHDVNYLKDIRFDFQNCTIIGDKGYISQEHKQILKDKSNVTFLTDSRKNQKVVDFIPLKFKGKRKKIETIFSQLNDQFNIQRNYTTTAYGYFSRIMSKLTSMTIMNYINKLNDKPLSQIKYAIA